MKKYIIDTMSEFVDNPIKITWVLFFYLLCAFFMFMAAMCVSFADLKIKTGIELFKGSLK